MLTALRHRGPDAGGTWIEPELGIALGHRRLAILDLSAAGNQPMHSADQRFVLVYNGEIYNFRALRLELEMAGHRFRGHSDTEVLLAGFCAWGVESMLKRCLGMFSLALWDREERTLYLARDRVGEKPLYYGWMHQTFLFGSELKALRAHPHWQAEINSDALNSLLRHGYINAPHSIYEGIFQLPPGCLLKFSAAQLSRREHASPPQPYWSFFDTVEAGINQPFRGDEESARLRLSELLRASVAGQMVADVPVGAFLSGGIDSSLVVAVMQEQSNRPIKTFSIGFEKEDFDEAPFAKTVARHLGTDHTELYVQERDLLQVVERLPEIYDEPFADTSQIPTVLLCELARTEVTVSLSGDGGDELFGGYDCYRKAQAIWQYVRHIPAPLRRRVASALKRFAADERNSTHALTHLLNRVENFADLFPATGSRALYQTLTSPCRDAQSWLKRGREAPACSADAERWEFIPDLLHRMMYHDSVSYLPNDILVKVDRAAMSVALETRVPFLDHRIIEFAWRLPAAFKQRHGRGKWLLRELLHQYVPPPLVDRPKKGFAAPMGEWLRGPLRDWAEELLSEARLRSEGFFNEKYVRQKWSEHLSGRRDWGQPLWHALTFQSWLDRQQRVRAEKIEDTGSVHRVKVEECKP